MTNTEAIIFLVSFIGFFGPLLIYGILKLTKRNLDNHKPTQPRMPQFQPREELANSVRKQT